MNPGRELDAQVAAKIMGIEKVHFKERTKDSDWIGIRPDERGRGFLPLKHYSTDISEAWEVVEQLRAREMSVDVHAYPVTRKWLKPPYKGAPAKEWKLLLGSTFYQCTICWMIAEGVHEWVVICDPEGVTPAHAICLAALEVSEREKFYESREERT